jgi:hypothetical protein
VVGDHVEALIQLLGEQVGAGDPLVENYQDLYAQRMRERFCDDLFDAVFLLDFRQSGFLTLFSGVATDHKTLKIATQDFHNVPLFFVYLPLFAVSGLIARKI